MFRNRFRIAVAAAFLVLSHVDASALDTGGFSNGMGSTAAAVTVTSLAQLKAAFDQKRNHIVVSGHIYGGPTLTTLTFASTDWNNTTIEGLSGSGASLENIQLKFDGEMLAYGVNIQNIVIKNISFFGRISDLQAFPTQAAGTNQTDGVNYEGVSLRRVTNAWIDHCDFHDTSDDLMSVALASDYVTVSNTKFYFTDQWMHMNPDPGWNWIGNWQDLANERLTMVVGASGMDSYAYGGYHLHVTLHHNWFGPNLRGRPLLRGWIHAYNNYFDNSTVPSGGNFLGLPVGQYNALQVGSGGLVVSEGNYFYMTNNSNQIGLDRSGDYYGFYERSTGASANFYDSTTGTSVTGSAFGGSPVFYRYTLDDTSGVPAKVKQLAGPM